MSDKSWKDRMRGALLGIAGVDYINADLKKEQQQSQTQFQNWIMNKMGGGEATPQIGMTPDGNMGITGITLTPSGGNIKIGETPGAKADRETETKKAKNIADVKFSADRVKNLMASTVKAWKTMTERAKQQTGREPGRIAGLYNKLGGMTGINPEVNPFEGQKLETAAALARIAMPGIRSARAIQQFYKTLPVMGSNEEEMIGQVRNSYHNAMSNVYASYGETYTEEERKKMDKAVDEILSSEGYGAKSFKTEADAEKANLPKGTIIFIGGKKAKVR